MRFLLLGIVLGRSAADDEPPPRDNPEDITRAGEDFCASAQLHDPDECEFYRCCEWSREDDECHYYGGICDDRDQDDRNDDRYSQDDRNDDRYSPCLLYTSPSPRDRTRSRMPSSA